MRRRKLTREERAKRLARRERRASTPRTSGFPEVEEFVTCERCGLKQPRGEGYILENGVVVVAPCINCKYEYARTPEYAA